MKVPAKFKKVAMLTDIHFGRRNNSQVHNQDCLDFISWFCVQVNRTGDYSHVAFLGDWFESRSAINIETMEYSYRGLQQLNSLGLPVYFCVGNHDLHKRTTRDVHSVRMFNELSNFTVIDKVTVEDNVLFSPYLFDHEYAELVKHVGCWAWFGHFEFKNFVITGSGQVMDHGPEHSLFKGPKKIFSGHFHKRQAQDNVHYIGNVFPMDFGDAGDIARGMSSYDVAADAVTYTDWPAAPSFSKTTLSEVLKPGWVALPKMKVKCTINQELGYQEAQELREAMIAAHELRDFILEEDREAKQGLLEGENVKVTEGSLDFSDVDDLVVKQLEQIKEDQSVKVDPNLLIAIYKDLKVEAVETT